MMKRPKANGEAEAKVAHSPKKPRLQGLTIPSSAQIAEVVADFRCEGPRGCPRLCYQRRTGGYPEFPELARAEGPAGREPR